MPTPNTRSHRRFPKHAQLAQHFFTSGPTADRIVDSLGLTGSEKVLELGAGKGFFTERLAKTCSSLTALEIAPDLVAALRTRFGKYPNVKIVRKSITSKLNLDRFDVLFGNIPFNRTAEILRRVCHHSARFNSCHLLVQTEAAYRVVPSARPTEMAVLAYPYVDARIGFRVPATAYSPPPSVNTAVLHILRRPRSLVRHEDARDFQTFVRQIFRSDVNRLSKVIGRDLSYKRWKSICQRVGIERDASHLSLDPAKYVELFDALRD
jgi:16S rRNA A1518/A1519 N6-dimethyltransferase RsmA/KsgA/DIM1 with predicted DNA glycosylase/AP lyase activity